MTREELAWAAGFFDGEGFVGLISNKKGRQVILRADICQIDRRVLDRFVQAVGVGRITGPYTRTNPNHRERYTWCVSGYERVQAVMCRLWAFLSPVKRDQFKEAVTNAREYYASADAVKYLVAARLLENRRLA